MNSVTTLDKLSPSVPADKSSVAPVAHSPLRRALIKLAVVAGTVLICLIILEIGLRVMDRYPMDNHEGYFAQGGISYVLKKNVTKKVIWPTMSFKVYTSDVGFRSSKPGPRNLGQRPYYVALGASDVFGNGLDYEQTFVGILDGKMQQQGIDVVNMGVAGHHLPEQAALLKSFVSSTTNPPQAVVVIFNPLFIGGYDDIHTNVLVKRGDLFEGDDWRMALIRKFLANTSAAYCFFRDGIRHAQKKFIGREDFALSFYIERFSSKHRIHRPEKTQEFLKQLKELDQYIRSVNATPIFVYCPPSGGFLLNDLKAKGKIDGSLFDTQFFADLIENYCKAEGVRYIDLHPLVQARYDKGEKLNFDADGHFNGPTSRLVGEYLYDVLKPDRHADSQ
jgi:hypothetical protein